MAQTVRPPRAWEAWREEFPVFTRALYYNTCSLGALSRTVADAVRAFLTLWDELGAAAWYGPWLGEIELVRAGFARLIGAETDEVAIFPSVTAALTAVASAYDYRTRPKVVLSDREFPTTVYQWLAKVRSGVELVTLRSPDPLTVPLELYEHAVDGRTQLVVASHVYFTSGAIQDVAALARAAHRHGAHLLVDAYQATGQLPTDVHEAGVDFLISGGLKWLLGGPGIAFLYVRRDVAAALRPTDVGWFAHRNQFAFDVTRFEHADGARRFEGGTPPVAAVYAARAGLDIVEEIGVRRLRERQVELVSRLVAEAHARGLRPRVPARVTDLAGIVTIPREDPAAVVGALRGRNIIIDQRPGLIRLSPYLYNTPEDGDRIIAEIVELERGGIR